jgi:CheY-like chemotaxis protein/HPt (histidine-containing phosphotransfer) domain-containing protein
MGDLTKLRQILTNLVGNAIKFSDKGVITVSAVLERQLENSWLLRFCVADQGIGISPAAQARVFDTFEQADQTTTKKYGGTGLGLAICRKLVALMGGEIWIESELGQGSRFFFTLQLAPAPADAVIDGPELPTRQAAAHPKGLRILLADDVEVNRELVKAILERDEHTIVEADNGREAVNAFISGNFDLVLMDVQMPEMDGLQAVAAIRRHEQEQQRGRTPVIAMTAYAGAGDREKCLAAGMDDYLTKPVKPTQVLEMLQRHSGVPVAIAEQVPAVIQPAETPALFARDELLERLGGAEALLPRFLGLFFKGVSPHLEGLEAAIASGEPDKIRMAAHAIKGSSANIGAMQLRETAAEIEAAAKAGDISAAPERYEILRQQLEAFKAATACE